ncbi:MAG: RNA pseudouridine synthase [Saprospiraceae bacterium]
MKNTFEVLYEDNHLLVVIKPANILSQGDETGDPSMMDLISDYLSVKYNKPGKAYVGLLHRLDRPVSGIMVFARTSKAFERIQAQIKLRTIDKYYLMLSDQCSLKEQEDLCHYLIKDATNNKVKISNEAITGSKECRLKYWLIGESEGKFLYKIQLITGRPHQIRAQMAFIGYPIMGDVKYGGYEPKRSKDLALYSHKMAIDHPILKERFEWTSYPEIKGYWKGFEVFFPLS